MHKAICQEFMEWKWSIVNDRLNSGLIIMKINGIRLGNWAGLGDMKILIEVDIHEEYLPSKNTSQESYKVRVQIDISNKLNKKL